MARKSETRLIERLREANASGDVLIASLTRENDALKVRTRETVAQASSAVTEAESRYEKERRRRNDAEQEIAMLRATLDQIADVAAVPLGAVLTPKEDQMRWMAAKLDRIRNIAREGHPDEDYRGAVPELRPEGSPPPADEEAVAEGRRIAEDLGMKISDEVALGLGRQFGRMRRNGVGLFISLGSGEGVQRVDDDAGDMSRSDGLGG